VRLLLDAHAFLWFLLSDSLLSDRARDPPTLRPFERFRVTDDG
jgi:hypothetical protein